MRCQSSGIFGRSDRVGASCPKAEIVQTRPTMTSVASDVSGRHRLYRSYEKRVAIEFRAPDTVLISAASKAAATTPRRPTGNRWLIMNA